MYGHIGYFLCLLGLLLSMYSVLAVGVHIRIRRFALEVSAQRAMHFATAGISCASVLLWIMFYLRDYSIEYIFKNSSNDLPPFYTLSAFWSSMEGSHLFWALILALVSSVALFSVKEELKGLRRYLILFCGVIMVWMFFLLITHSDPFQLRLPPPGQGLGMNALLQNPYMAIHPPSLFLGYTALVVPYAYSMAALCSPPLSEKSQKAWLRVMRSWCLFAWLFLTIGIALGGRWAYVELGWGGYWAWDPVENSSFIPWLLSTALMHGLLIQEKSEKRGMVKWNYLLAILAFFFSFFGTFLTRSGIITSVHSFAESDIGEAYVYFLALLLGLSVLIYIFRSSTSTDKSLPNSGWVVSREMMMVLGMCVLCVFAVVVTTGTLYPIFSEIVSSVRVNVQAPYFNAFAPWLGAGLALLMALGAVMRYGSAKIYVSQMHAVLVVVGILVCGGVFAWLSGVFDSSQSRLYVQLCGIALLFFAIWCVVIDIHKRFQSSGYRLGLFVRRSCGFLGGSLAHIGFLLALLGFLGNYRGTLHTVQLAQDTPTEVAGYTLEYRGLDHVQEDNATLYKAVVAVHYMGQFFGIMTPARSKYPTKEELMHEVAVSSRLWNDLYLVLSHPPTIAGGPVTLQVYVNPLVKLVWFALVVMVLGGLVALVGRPLLQKSWS